MSRITVADVAARLDKTDEAITGLTNVLGQIVEQMGQHNTAAPVAEVTSKKAAKVEPVLSPRDLVLAGVKAKGLAFAKGGALQGSVAVAEAIVRVLKANKPGGFEIVSVQGDIESFDKRKVTHIAVGLLAPGHFFTQYVYTPEGA